MSLRDDLVEQALGFPPQDRAFIADALEYSLVDGELTTEYNAAWAKEIESRIAAFDQGGLAAMDANSVLQDIRARIAHRRSNNQ